jgi:hypothetical protein
MKLNSDGMEKETLAGSCGSSDVLMIFLHKAGVPGAARIIITKYQAETEVLELPKSSKEMDSYLT